MHTDNILNVKRKIYVVMDFVLLIATIVGIVETIFVAPQDLLMYVVSGFPVIVILCFILIWLRDTTKIKIIEIVGLISILSYLLFWGVANIINHSIPSNEYMFSNTPIIIMAGVFITLAAPQQRIMPAMLLFFGVHTLLTWINLLYFAWGIEHAAQLTTDLVTLAVLLAITLLGEYNANLVSSQNAALSMSILAATDVLTGLANRRHMQHLLQTRSAQILVEIDLDFFKKINDEHGHDTGDEALCLVASIIDQVFCQYGKVARWGGEEFLVSLIGIDKSYAIELAEQARQMVHQQSRQRGMPITISLGLAMQLDNENIMHTVKRADNCLYKAKEQGRNRLVAE